ncbi:hypothetical protein AB0G02_35840 [Actinosynnema sp. NPDC023658]|uniref:hypothetical protein n=1 Tax=Actinosynnema sp. NPDC023658 TaxID=3155465 RepID=UPI0033ECA28F
MWARMAGSALAVVVGVGVTACGSGVFGRTGDVTTTGPTTSTTSTDGTGPGVTGTDDPADTGVPTAGGTRFGWYLPEGPRSTSTVEDSVYQRLAVDRDCDAAQTDLDDGNAWEGMRSPRNVLLYQAAIDLCRGAESSARAVYGRIAGHGWNLELGSTEPVDCPTYRAVRSVLDQRESGTFECTRGTPPAWPDPQAKNDPRTDVDESAPTTDTTTGTTDTTTPTTPETGTTTTTREPTPTS